MVYVPGPNFFRVQSIYRENVPELFDSQMSESFLFDNQPWPCRGPVGAKIVASVERLGWPGCFRHAPAQWLSATPRQHQRWGTAVVQKWSFQARINPIDSSGPATATGILPFARWALQVRSMAGQMA